MLILIRHGETETNVQRLLNTCLPGPELTQRGRDQAATAAQALHSRFGVGVDIYSSEAVRAVSTATIIAQQAGWLYRGSIRDIKELSAGQWEMSGEEATMAGYHEVLHQWLRGNDRPQVPGGEEYQAAVDRARRGLAELVAGPQPVAVVSHGAFARLALSVLSDVDPEYSISHPFKNCEGAVVEDGRVTHWGAF